MTNGIFLLRRILRRKTHRVPCTHTLYTLTVTLCTQTHQHTESTSTELTQTRIEEQPTPHFLEMTLFFVLFIQEHNCTTLRTCFTSLT